MLYYSYSFQAYDEIGLTYTIDVYTNEISAGSADTSSPRSKTLRVAGQEITRSGRGRYTL